MSEQPEPSDSGSQRSEKEKLPDPAPDKLVVDDISSAEKNTSSSPSRWRRRFRRLAFVAGGMLALALLLRFVFWLALPTILDKAAQAYGFRCSYDDLSLTILTGDLELWHFELTSIESGEVVIDMEYCRGDVLVSALLQGRLVLRRMEVDGVDFTIHRAKDGGFPAFREITDAVAGWLKEEKDEVVFESIEPTQPADLDLTVPLQLDALRLQHCYVYLRDESLSPPVETRLDINVKISDLGSERRKTRFHFTLSSPGVLGQLSFEGKANNQDGELEIDMRASGRGIRLVERAAYLEAWGIRPSDADLYMGFEGKLRIAPKPAKSGPEPEVSEPGLAETKALEGQLELSKIFLRVGDEEQLALDRVSVELETLTGRELRVRRVDLEGGLAILTRQASGVPLIAGLEILRVPGRLANSQPPVVQSSTGSPAAPAEVSPAPEGDARRENIETQVPATFVWSLGEVSLRKFQCVVRDRAVAQDHQQIFDLRELVFTEIRSGPDAEPILIRGDFAASGLVESLRLEAALNPLVARKTLRMTVTGSGVTGKSASPYLAALDIEPLLEDGKFSCSLDASLSGGFGSPLTADFSLSEVIFSDGEELFAFGGIDISGVEIAPSLDRIVVDRIEGSGPGFSVEREAFGSVKALGFRWQARKDAGGGLSQHGSAPRSSDRAGLARATLREGESRVMQVAATTEEASHESPGSSALDLSLVPAIELRHFIWKGRPIHFIDQTLSPVHRIDLTDLVVELEDFIIEPRGSSDTKAGKIRASLSLPGLIERISASGTLASVARGARFDLEVLGSGVTAKASTPYLEASGITPGLKDGQLRARVSGFIAESEGSLVASLEIDDARLEDSGEVLIGLTSGKIDGVRVEAGKVHVDSIELVEPRTLGWRTAGGELRAAMFRIERPGAVSSGASASSISEDVSPRSSGDSRPIESPASPLVIEVDKFRIKNASLAWRDAGVQPAVDTALIANMSLDGLVFSDGAPPATLDVEVKVPASLERLSLSGKLHCTPSLQRLDAAVDLAGLRAGPLASYFAEFSGGGVRLALEDGRASARIDMSLARHESGGFRGELKIEDAVFREGSEGTPILAVDAARVAVSRIDLQGELIDVEEISVAGLKSGIERSVDGELLAFGLGLEIPVSSSAPRESKNNLGDADGAVVRDAVASPTKSGEGSDGLSPERELVSETTLESKVERPVRWPTIRLGSLDLGLERFTVIDRARPESEPLILSEFRLRSLGGLELLGEDPDSHAAAKFELVGSAAPLFDLISVKAEASPFASVPAMRSELEISGAHGDGWTRLIPELKPFLDGSKLTDGRVKGRMEFALNAKRRHALDFGLEQGIGFNLIVEEFRFDGGKDAIVYAGVDRAEIDVARISPEGDVHVRRIEIATPRGNVSREDDGIHVLGFVFPDPLLKRGAEKEEQGVASEASVADPVLQEGDRDADVAGTGTGTGASANANAKVAEAEGETGEVEAEEARDIVATSAVEEASKARRPEIRIDEIIVTGVDFTLTDTSVEPRMVFPLKDLDVEIKGITTRVKDKPGVVSIHAFASAGKVRLPRVDSEEFEERELFERATMRGRLSLFPSPRGWLKLGVSHLELANFKGNAAELGFELDGGVFDTGMDMRFRGDDKVSASTRLIFTDLQVSETEEGPIASYLHLPAPLGAVIFILRDEGGAVDIPLGFEAGLDGMSLRQILAAGVSALSLTIGKAVANSPFRVGGAIGGLFGEDEEIESEETVAIAFEPGAVTSAPGQGLELAPLVQRLREEDRLVVTLRHDLGRRDLAIAAARANPSHSDAAALLGRLRKQRQKLLDSKAALAAEIRAGYASGARLEAVVRRGNLLAVHEQLGNTERALDQVLVLFRRGAEGQAKRRTRDSLVAIGAARLRSVRETLLSIEPDLAERIRILRPRYTVSGEREYSEVSVASGMTKAPGS